MTLDLAQVRPLVEIMAAERTKSRPDLFPDAVQEGLVAAWEASESRPDAPPSYVHAAARNGVIGVLQGRPFTGEEGRRGWKDAHGSSGPLVVEDDEGDEVFVKEPVDDPHGTDFDAAEIRSRVRAAVRAIPDPLDREIVFLRFWNDNSFQTIAEHVGRPAGTLSRRWTSIIRPFLREELEEVADHAV